MTTVKIRQHGSIGKVKVTPPIRTTIADPKYQPKPNIALTELVDVSIQSLSDGESVIYDSGQQKFIIAPISEAQVNISRIVGGFF